MNLQPVAVLPKFSYLCTRCRIRFSSLERAPVADLDGPPFAAYYCNVCGNVTAMQNGAQAAVASAEEEEGEEEPYDPPGRCSSPEGHVFRCTGTQYGGDDPRWNGEGRCFCIYCGADGDT